MPKKVTEKKEGDKEPEKMVRTEYDLKLTLLEPMLGTVPYNKDVYAKYIESKKPPEVTEGETETVQEKDEKTGWTGYHKDAKGLFIYDYMIKGFLKNAAGVLKEEGEAGPKKKINDYLFVRPRRIYLGKKESDGILERPLRAQTMQGPRVTLVRSDMIKEGTEIKCQLIVLSDKKVSESTLNRLLEYGEFMGLGQFRNGTYGSFSYALKRVK